MNKRELIERMEGLKNLFGNKSEYVEIDTVIELISELDEPETGHADEAPRYVKNILARLRELPVHDREVWLKAIMGEFEQDFSHAKWREGYEVEKAKRYLVTLKNGQPLVKSQSGSTLYFSQDITAGNYKVTRKELEEADFGWVFDCPGIEVEEV